MNKQQITYNSTLNQTFDKISKGNKNQNQQNKQYNVFYLTILLCLFAVILLVGSNYIFNKQMFQTESSLNFDFSNQKLRNMQQANNISNILKNSLFNDYDDNQITQLTIDLSQNQIEEDIASQIVHTLKNYISLTTLNINLSKNNLGEDGGCKIVQALNAIQSLTTLNLDLSYNQIGDDGIVKIAEAFQNYKSLMNLTIDLFGNPAGDRGWSKSLQIFNNYTFFFKIYSSLVLDFKNQMLSLDYSEQISKIINILNSLTALSDKNKFLTSLSIDLSQNQIGLKTAHDIADALKDFKFLTNLSLNLSQNNLGEEGASVIIEALVSSQSLTELRLDLNQNNIGDKGVIKIAEVFKNNLSLNNVYLSILGNPVGQTGWITLVSTMKKYIFFPKIHSSLVLKFKSEIRKIDYNTMKIESYFQEDIDILNNCQKLTDNNFIIADLNLDLSSIHLNRNEAEEISNVLKNYSQLTILNVNLANNKLEGNVLVIIESLKNYESLNTLSLNLSTNKMRDMDIFNALQPLKNYQQLKTIQLNLCGSDMLEEASSIIQELIVQQKYLTTLDLDLCYQDDQYQSSYFDFGYRFDPLTYERIGKIVNAIKSQQYLTSLSIGLRGQAKYLSLVVESFKFSQNLTILKLDMYNTNIDDYGTQQLSESLETLQSLTSFTFISGFFTNFNPSMMIKSLKKCKSLKNLNLNISSNVKIVDILKELTNLTSLDFYSFLSDIKEYEAVMIALSDLIPLKKLFLSICCPKIKISKPFQQLALGQVALPFKNLKNLELIIGICQLGDDGVQGIAYFLRNLKSLVSLRINIQHNNIQNKGAQLIAESLDELAELNSLMLEFFGNQLQDEGALILANTLMNHKKLTNLQLYLKDNNLSGEGKIQMRQNMQQLSDIRGVVVQYQD